MSLFVRMRECRNGLISRSVLEGMFVWCVFVRVCVCVCVCVCVRVYGLVCLSVGWVVCDVQD